MENQAQQPNQSTQVYTTPVINEPKKSFQKWILVALMLIVIMIVGVGAYFLGKSSSVRPVEKVQITAQNPTITLVPTATTTEAVNWKTYTNTKYGFSFEYPAEGDVVINQADPSKTQKGVCGKFIKESVENNIDEIKIDDLFGIIIQKTTASTIANWVNQAPDDPGKIDLSNFSKITGTNADEAYKSNDSVMIVAIYKKGNNIITINHYQDLSVNGGCISYNKSINWNIPSSLKFD